MKFYAHTAKGADGKPLPESSGQWQLLTTHPRDVAETAQRLGAALGFSAEAELVILLHDL